MTVYLKYPNCLGEGNGMIRIKTLLSSGLTWHFSQHSSQLFSSTGLDFSFWCASVTQLHHAMEHWLGLDCLWPSGLWLSRGQQSLSRMRMHGCGGWSWHLDSSSVFEHVHSSYKSRDLGDTCLPVPGRDCSSSTSPNKIAPTRLYQRFILFLVVSGSYLCTSGSIIRHR